MRRLRFRRDPWRSGRIVDAAKKKLSAPMSYNGRVWLADGGDVDLDRNG